MLSQASYDLDHCPVSRPIPDIPAVPSCPLAGKLEELVEKLAENTHMVWSKERIQQGWTYGLNEVSDGARSQTVAH